MKFLKSRFLGLSFAFVMASTLFAQKSIQVGSFNMLRLSQTSSKNFERMIELIDSGNFDLLAAVEIMNPAGAYKVLKLLQEKDVSWRLKLSPTANGEQKYKEYFAYFYKENKIKPSTSTKSLCSHAKHSAQSEKSFCFLKDTYEDGPDFERDPYVGHFKAGSTEFTFLLVHLYYGDNTSVKIEKRKAEAVNLKDGMALAHKLFPESNVIALGDFNLKLQSEDAVYMHAPSSAVLPSSIFNETPKVSGLIEEATTIGLESYDHILYLNQNSAKYVSQSAEALWDFDREDADLRAIYKKEVSDHVPVRAEFSVR